jgi:Xaa-Pro aminopeptidase
MNLAEIQSALAEAKLDGWLFYDHHRRDPIAYRVLGIEPQKCSRRWYYLIPSAGEPRKLVHRIEKSALDGLPGEAQEYSSWREQHEALGKMLTATKTVAMQYSHLNDIPYVGLVDAGTVELVRSFGVEVVTSADLVQLFEARWSDAAFESHLETGSAVHALVRRAFELIRDSVRAGKSIGEYEVQQEIFRLYEGFGIRADEPLAICVNENTGNPHYSPTAASSQPIRQGDFVLVDAWAKLPMPGAVYFDITWTGFVGEEVPARYTEIFEIVKEARDTAVDFIQQAVRAGRPIRGYQVDDAARGVITRHGYGDYFVHRTGHSIGEDVHGNGANMDNFEMRDDRRIIPRTCFSIEPGIYFPEFGVRSEVNVYVEEHDARVTGAIQQAIIPIMALR